MRRGFKISLGRPGPTRRRYRTKFPVWYTLTLNGVDQKWLSGYALVEGAEVMLTIPEIRGVSLGFCLSACNDVLTNGILAII